MLQIHYDELEYVFEEGCYYFQGSPFTGKAVESLDEVLIAELHFKNGLQDGIQKQWYSSGKLQSVYHFLDGGGHGTNKEWYESGELKIQTTIEFGVVTERLEWNQQGELKDRYELKTSDLNYNILQARRERWANAQK